MTLNCSNYLSIDSKVDILGSNDTNHSMIIIWVDEDLTPIFAGEYWFKPSFWIGLSILIIFIVTISSCIVYRYSKRDKIQKLKKLATSNIDPILREDVKSVLEIYIPHHNLIDIIMDFANIVITDKSIMEYINTIMTSTISLQQEPIAINSKFLQNRFLLYLLTLSLLIFAYIPMYHFTVHLQDSYRSYVETNCMVIQRECLEWNDDKSCHTWQNVYEIDMEPICDKDTLNTDSIKFYSKFFAWDESQNDPCFIGETENKEELRIRKSAQYKSFIARCGYAFRCCPNCANQSSLDCCPNCCLYGICLGLALMVMMYVISRVLRIGFEDIEHYDIVMKSDMMDLVTIRLLN